MGDSFQISVLGQKFNLAGAHDLEYISRVETFLNQRIDQIRQAGGPVDTTNLMILVALNLVDECLKKEDELEQAQEHIENNATRLINLIDSRI
ncbi:cell division protein ZapA [Thermodesulfobacteriota bacterium]